MPAPIYWPQGNTHTPMYMTLQSNAGQILDLTGVQNSNISVHLRPILPNAASAPCAGAATILTPATAGTINFYFAPSDVATPGYYTIGVTIIYGPGDEQTVFEQVFVIQSAT